SQVLEDNQKKGGITMKIEVAYFRAITFNDPSRQQAEDIYLRFVTGGIPSEKEYRTFQDYIFRYLIQEGGSLHLPVHIHSAVGIGDYFNLSQSNIMNLESVLRDPRYRSTTFVMIHGGYPLEREAIFLAAMKNVYMDSSEMELIQYPSAFKDTLKQWLETFPDKITFGTDCFPYNEVLGAEESYWLGAESSRMALAAALAEMISEKEITEARALELAHAYLHDNAVKLYQGRVHGESTSRNKGLTPMAKKPKNKTSAGRKAKAAKSHSRAQRAVTKHAVRKAQHQYVPCHTIPLAELNPLLQRQFVVGQEIMLARVLLKKGCIVPEHSHHNEQLTYILDGALKFWIDGKEIIVHSGEVLCIPAH